MFDGVHVGHQVLLERAKVLAKRSNVPLVACTFTDHPLSLIAPERCPPMLTTFEERASLLEEIGVDLLFAQPFTEEMRQMPPEVYVGELVRRFHPVDVVCGYNHTFGKDGSGTSAFLAALGDALGFRTQVVPQVTLEGADVSSSTIRVALSCGEVASAAHLLGRPYQMGGQLIGIANRRNAFIPDEARKQQPASGYYRCLMVCPDEKRTWPCVVSVSHQQPWKLRGINATAQQTVQLRFLTMR